VVKFELNASEKFPQYIVFSLSGSKGHLSDWATSRPNDEKRVFDTYPAFVANGGWHRFRRSFQLTDEGTPGSSAG